MAATTATPAKIAVLMTCFNRREQTLRCLERLGMQAGQAHFHLTVFLVDDGSTDGTRAAVQARFPAVRVLLGTGSLYWNQGMRLAFEHALPQRFDYFLWLNDDTHLLSTALQTLLETSIALESRGIHAIVTGSTRDRLTGTCSYGGMRWEQGWQRRLTLVTPDPAQLVPCDTMNGNCTLIPRKVAQTVGNLDAAFQHSFGDLDYGFRARAAGFSVYVAPGFLGECSDNPRQGTWRDRSATFRRRWKHLNSAKGSPYPEWSLYCRRHLGVLWPLYAVSPYLKTLTTSLAERVPR